MTLTTSIKLILEGLFAQAASASQFATGQANINRSLITSLADGAGLNQANRIFSETRTIAASGTYIYDLTTLSDIFANAITFARLKGIFVFADPGNTNNVVIGDTAADQFLGPLDAATSSIAVAPGGCWISLNPTAAGWALGATTDLLFTNSGGGTGVTFDVVFLGAAT